MYIVLDVTNEMPKVICLLVNKQKIQQTKLSDSCEFYFLVHTEQSFTKFPVAVVEWLARLTAKGKFSSLSPHPKTLQG